MSLTNFGMPIVLARAEGGALVGLTNRAALALAIYVSNIADSRSRVYAYKVSEVARLWGVSHNTVSEWGAALEAAGWVCKVRAQGRNGVRGELGPMFGMAASNTAPAVRAYVKVCEVQPVAEAAIMMAEAVGTDKAALKIWYVCLRSWLEEGRDVLDVAGLVRGYVARRAFGGEGRGKNQEPRSKSQEVESGKKNFVRRKQVD